MNGSIVLPLAAVCCNWCLPPQSDELATAAQFLVQSALQQWLGELIQVEAVQVASQDATLQVTVQYVHRRTEQRQIAEFTRGGTGL